MGPAVSRPDDGIRLHLRDAVDPDASMGPAVSRPDDALVRTLSHAVAIELQWGRPFRGRMTRKLRSANYATICCFNGAGRFAAG